MTDLTNCIDAKGVIMGVWLAKCGYYQFHTSMKNGKRSKIYAHRHVFEECFGWIPPVVRHSCDNPQCVNPEHLLGGTQADNVKDMWSRRRGSHGERHPGSKLSDDEVEKIKVRLAKDNNPARLAEEYGVSRALIHHIKNGRQRCRS